MIFRRVTLADSIPGKLYLTDMPGRFEPIHEFIAHIHRLSISRVVCLTPLDEVREKSPDYYHLITSGTFSGYLEHFPIPDYGIPEEQENFLLLSKKMAGFLKTGDNIVIHCNAGIGRTGSLAMVILMTLGMERIDAAAAVRDAHSQPEGISQRGLIDWCAHELHK